MKFILGFFPLRHAFRPETAPLRDRAAPMNETPEEGAFLTPAESSAENPFEANLVTPAVVAQTAQEQLDDATDESFVLLASLRSQITDLSSQVTSLNSKLVSSYTRIGDLEDDLHDKGQKESRAQAQVEALQNDKISWETQIESGGWIERVGFYAPLVVPY